MYAWDVVDEAISEQNPYAVVSDYICKAFKTARAADSEPLLFYSDTGFADTTDAEKAKSDEIFTLVKQLKDGDCNIDGVAMKINLDVRANETAIEGVRANIKRYNTLGLKVHLSRVVIECVTKEDGTCDQHYSMYYEQE